MSHLSFGKKVYAAWQLLNGHSIILFVDGIDVTQDVCTEHALESAVNMRALSNIYASRLKPDPLVYKKRVNAAMNELIESEEI